MKAAQASAYLNGRTMLLLKILTKTYMNPKSSDFLNASVKKNRENFQIIMEDIMMKIAPIAYK